MVDECVWWGLSVMKEKGRKKNFQTLRTTEKPPDMLIKYAIVFSAVTFRGRDLAVHGNRYVGKERK
jgi:hypothetical protein